MRSEVSCLQTYLTLLGLFRAKEVGDLVDAVAKLLQPFMGLSAYLVSIYMFFANDSR